MYRYFHGSDRNSIPAGLPSRLVDPMLRTIGEQPQFLKIGEGNNPRNELLRVVNQYPSKDEIRTKVLKDILAVNPTDKYDVFSKPNNAYALTRASEDLGIPLESIGFSVDPNSNAFRLKGSLYTDSTAIDNARTLVGRVASTQAKAGNPYIYNQLQKKQEFFAQPRSHSEIAVDGTEGEQAIYEAYKKAEPDVTASSQGNRPILPQADGLNPNIGIPAGSPENIPPMDIEGMKGANRYVDVSQGLETARVIEYPNIYDRLNKGAQPTITATIPYAADIPTALGDSILSPKVSVETKRPRFIQSGLSIYTRQGERINAEQKNLLDTGMADLEDRSFILRDPASVNQTPVRALASALPPNYYSQRDRNIPATPEAIPLTRMARDINNTPIYYSELPANYYGVKRDIPDEDRAKYTLQPVKGNWATGVTVIDETKPLTDEIGSIIGYKPTAEEYRDSKRLGFEILGMGQKSKSTLNIPEKVDYVLEDGTATKELWGTSVEVPTGRQAINAYVKPSQSKEMTAVIPARRMSDSMSDRILHVPGYLQRYEPFKSNRNTYGATQGKTPWREYYSDPFVYEDKGLDGEVNRLVKAVNEAPAQLENALTQQTLANRRAIEASDKLKFLGQNQSVRMGLLPQGEGVVNLAREVRKDRRMAEIDAAKANDTIAQLKAAQELMGVEYMVKPKLWDLDTYNSYRRASRNFGGVKNSWYYEQEPRLDTFALWEDSMARDNARFKAIKTTEPRQARPAIAPTFSRPKPTIGELFGFTALTPEGLAKYRDIE